SACDGRLAFNGISGDRPPGQAPATVPHCCGDSTFYFGKRLGARRSLFATKGGDLQQSGWRCVNASSFSADQRAIGGRRRWPQGGSSGTTMERSHASEGERPRNAAMRSCGSESVMRGVRRRRREALFACAVLLLHRVGQAAAEGAYGTKACDAATCDASKATQLAKTRKLFCDPRCSKSNDPWGHLWCNFEEM
ncbi:unnamed protein product, partial [Phaeothamnion confervicola]